MLRVYRNPDLILDERNISMEVLRDYGYIKK